MATNRAKLIKNQVSQELDELDETELKQIVDYIAFLKFRARHKAVRIIDEEKLASLYSEFDDEDRELAEIGISNYYEGLKKEDSL